MGYHLNHLDEPVFMVGLEPMLAEFGIHYGLESCVGLSTCKMKREILALCISLLKELKAYFRSQGLP